MTHLNPPQITPMNTGQARHHPHRTPDCLLSAPPDARECYRALLNLTTRELRREGRETPVLTPYFITARALACLLNWRYARAEAALEELRRKRWAGSRQAEGREEWTVTP